MLRNIKIKYLISSNVNYYQKTLPKILPSITKQINIKNIIVTIGGKSFGEQVGLKTFWVSHNSFEYTSLINFIELNYFDCDYVFLLHDTMICGNNFHKLSSRIDASKNVIMAHEKGWCNLGAFKTSFLFSIKDKLLSMKNIKKKEAIELEGSFFGQSYCTYKNPTVERMIDCEKSPYGGRDRFVCEFKSVNVYKYGSNDANSFKNGLLNVGL